MPKLACWACGRQIYTVAPLEALFAEERRCPRCGAFLEYERSGGATGADSIRRVNPPDEPGPPGGRAASGASPSGGRCVAALPQQ